MYKVKFSLLIFGSLSLFCVSSKGVLESIVSSKAGLICPDVLQNSSTDFKSMFLQIKLIVDKVEVTSINKNVLDDIQKRLSNKSHWNDQRVEIETLLTIFYFLHTPPSLALSSSNLYMYMDFDKLKSRSYLSEANMQQLLIVVNRHLRNYIRGLQSKFAIHLDKPDFSIEDLAEKIHVPYQTLYNILNTDFVPNYLQMTQILNRGYSTVITFFKKVENSQEFRTIFNSHYSETIEKEVVYNRLNEGNLYNIYMRQLQSRLPVMLAKLAPHISQLDISRILDWPNITNIELESVTMDQLFRLAHIFNRELLQVLADTNFSLLYPLNLEMLHEMYIQMALHQLARNIRKEMNTSRVSVYELSVHLGLSRSELESILNGINIMTYRQFAQISQKLWNGREDPLTLLKRLLRGVSTLYYRMDSK